MASGRALLFCISVLTSRPNESIIANVVELFIAVPKVAKFKLTADPGVTEARSGRKVQPDGELMIISLLQST